MKRILWFFLGLGVLAFASCGSDSKKGSEPESNPNNPVVLIETSMGNIKVELFPEDAPITVENFLRYVDEKHYDGTIFHRVISDFMIQGGGFTEDFAEKEPHDSIKNEASNGLSNKRGTIAMARTSDPNSATDQFFINVADNGKKGLDYTGGFGGNPGYAVFGKVVEGMDVVDQIRAVATDTKKVKIQGMYAPFDDVPVDNVIIKSIRKVK